MLLRRSLEYLSVLVPSADGVRRNRPAGELRQTTSIKNKYAFRKWQIYIIVSYRVFKKHILLKKNKTSAANK